MIRELVPDNSPLNFLKALISPFGSGTVMRNVEMEMVLNGWAWVVEKMVKSLWKGIFTR